MRLLLLPRWDGYTAMQYSLSQTTELEGGASARRKILDNADIVFTVNFNLNRDKYAYFIDFYEQWLSDTDANGRLKPFDILLIYKPTNPEFPLQNFKCVFSDEPVSVSEPNGMMIIVSATLIGYLDEFVPTSDRYPIGFADNLNMYNGISFSEFVQLLPTELIFVGNGSILSVDRNSIVKKYEMPQEDNVNIISGAILYADSQSVIKRYVMPEAELVNVYTGAILNAQRTLAVIHYENWPPEEFNVYAGKILSAERN